MITIIALPTDFVANITTTASDLFGDLSPYISLIIGVMLAIVVVGYLINSFTKH